MADRLRFFAPDNIAVELLVDEVPFAIAAADQGWAALPARSALLATTAAAVHARPELLPVGGPTTFLHGDWKMGNLGVHPDGRTILIDWAYPGAGPACWELCWYLALNQARLPESKEETVERYRRALEAAGVGTTDWWQTQLDVCTIGVMVTFGWEKALGSDAELLWWEGRVAEAIERQRLRV
jgi:thiamine kinase-like enzyme